MRVISGKCKSLPLKAVPGMNTRPTTDRIKETLFNMIASYIPECSFMDLFAGSGGIGIEALSRGARSVCFVEKDKRALGVIKENLTFTKLESSAHIFATDGETALREMISHDFKPFDLIFMDPPYDKNLEKQMLTILGGSPLIHRDTIIIVEASLSTNFDYTETLGFRISKEKIYKTNKHVFIKVK